MFEETALASTTKGDAELTEAGNARRLARRHRDHIMFAGGQWYVWDDQRWCRDTMNRVHELALETADSILEEEATAALKASDEVAYDRLCKWAKASRSSGRLSNMVRLAARSIADIKQDHTLLDSDPRVLNTLSGLVNLSTGELEKTTRDHLVTHLVPVEYKPTAQCPLWEQTLDEVFLGDAELIEWFQRAVGYSLTGLTDEQCMFILQGSGSNGKTTILETLKAIMGDYATAADLDSFMGDTSSVRTLEALAALQGRRVAVATETGTAKRIKEGVIKRITGGDTIRATFLNENSFEFRPQFKLWFGVNELPMVKDPTHGFWRRMRVIPLRRKFTPKDGRDGVRLERLLREEREGILAWAVEGARLYLRAHRTGGDLGSCTAIDKAVREYRADQDEFAIFLEEETRDSLDATVPQKDLLDRFVHWYQLEQENQGVARSTGQEIEKTVMSRMRFSAELVKRGYSKSRTKKGAVHGGLELKSGTNADQIGAVDF